MLDRVVGKGERIHRSDPSGSLGEVMLVLHALNFRVLRKLVWPLEGVSVLTGANGAGKTTALFALRLLRSAYDRGLPEAVSLTLGGSHNLRHQAASAEEPVELGLEVDGSSWCVRLIPRAATVDHLTDEWLERDGHDIFRRDSLGNFWYRGERQQIPAASAERLGLRWVTENHPEDVDAAQVAAHVSKFQVYFDPDIRSLRDMGSRASEDRQLHTLGRNVFTMLRKWRDRKQEVHRFQFVHEGLRAAFPSLYADMDFEAGQTVTVRIYRPGDEVPHPISNEANGLVSLLLHFTEIAAAPSGGVVAIDEPENSLHPYAIRRFVRLARTWARQIGASIVLTTHSPVVLDEFNAEPERIFVLEPERETQPVRLDELRDRGWLASYTLGELYTGGEFASNEQP